MESDPCPQPVHLSIQARYHRCRCLFVGFSSMRLEDMAKLRIGELYLGLIHWARLLSVTPSRGPNLDSLLDPSRDKLRSQINNLLDRIISDLVCALESTLTLGADCRVPFGHFDPHLDKIESSFAKLCSFTNQLLYYTPTGLGRRVAAYREMHADPDFDSKVTQYIQSQFPCLTSGLVNQKNPWWRKRGIKLFEPDRAAQGEETMSDEPAGLFKALVDAILFTHYRTRYERDCGEKERRDALDPKIASTRLPIKQSPAVTLKGQSDCPVCGETCYSPSSGNLSPDEIHFLHTVKPYVCLYERCNRLYPPSFETRQQWENHMHRNHTSGWIALLQENVQWLCRECNCASPKEFASVDLAARDLVRHQCTYHEGQDTEHAFYKALMHYVPCFRPRDTCPICDTCYPVDPKHPAGPDTRNQASDCVARHMLELSTKFTQSELEPAAEYVLSSELPPSPLPTSTPLRKNQSSGVIKPSAAGRLHSAKRKRKCSSDATKPRRLGASQRCSAFFTGPRQEEIVQCASACQR